MMKDMSITMMVVVLSITSRMIIADESDIADDADNAYVGIQYAVTSYNVDNFDEANPTVPVGRLGTFFNDYFALEGRLGLDLQDDTVNFSPTNVTVELDGLLGIYGLGHYNFNKTSSIYGLIGFTRVKATESRPGFNSVSIYDSDLP